MVQLPEWDKHLLSFPKHPDQLLQHIYRVEILYKGKYQLEG